MSDLRCERCNLKTDKLKVCSRGHMKDKLECDLCEASYGRVPVYSYDFFRPILIFVVESLQIEVVRSLGPCASTGWYFWTTSPIGTDFFGVKRDPDTIEPEETLHFASNSYLGQIYVPPGNQFECGCTLLHEAAHLMIGSGNPSKDDEDTLAAWERAVLKHLGLPLHTWYRWQSVTGGDETHADMKGTFDQERKWLISSELLDKKGAYVPMTYEVPEPVTELASAMSNYMGGGFFNNLLQDHEMLQKRHRRLVESHRQLVLPLE